MIDKMIDPIRKNQSALWWTVMPLAYINNQLKSLNNAYAYCIALNKPCNNAEEPQHEVNEPNDPSTSRELLILMKSDAICAICLFSWSVCDVGNSVCALQISEMIPNAILSGRPNERISAVSWPWGQLKEPLPSDSRAVMAEADVI